MGNVPNAKVPTPPTKKRRRGRRTAISEQVKNGDLDRKRVDGDSREGSCEGTDPHNRAKHGLTVDDVKEVVQEVTKREHQNQSIFITNLCAITRFCLEHRPSLTEVKDYVKCMKLGDALLTFILNGPHPSLLPQNSLPWPLNKANSEGPTTEPNLVKQQHEASDSGTPIRQQQSMVTACVQGAEGKSTHLDHPPQALQASPPAIAGAVQHTVVADSAPIYHQPNQQPPQEHGLNERSSPIQGTAGPNFTTRQHPLPGLTTASAPALAQTSEEQKPLPTTQFPFTVPPGQVSQYASNTVNQGSSNPVQQPPTSSAVQQFPHGSHPANPAVQPVMAQPFQMHNAQQSHPTPLNITSKQSQTPAAHLVPTQVHAGQPTSWVGQSQVPPPTMQSNQGPTVPSSSAPPTMFFPGSQWATPGSTQISGQSTMPVQHGSITLPTQNFSQPHGQPGTLHMFPQQPVTQSQAGNAPNPLWPGPSQDGNAPDELFDLPFP